MGPLSETQLVDIRLALWQAIYARGCLSAVEASRIAVEVAKVLTQPEGEIGDSGATSGPPRPPGGDV